MAHSDDVRPETMFSDDMTLCQRQEQLGVPIVPGGENLAHLLDHFKAAERADKAWHLAGMTQPQGAYVP